MSSTSRSAGHKPTTTGQEATEGTIDQAFVKAIANPLRYALLSALNEGEASPSDLARRFDENLSKITYNLKVLEELHMVELAERQIRGHTVVNIYRAVQRAWFASADWAKIPLAARHTLIDAALCKIAEHVTSGIQSGGFDRHDMHVTYTPLQLDEEGFAQVAAIMAQALQDILDVQAECLPRLTDDTTLTSQAVMLHFEAPPA